MARACCTACAPGAIRSRSPAMRHLIGVMVLVGVVPVTGDYHINNGTLTLEAGATLAFKDGATLHVGYNDAAKLIVKGTADAPVRFTAMGDKVPGVWAGVELHEHAARSQIDHLV